MPTADAEPALVEDIGQLEDLDEPPAGRGGRGTGGGARENGERGSRDVGRDGRDARDNGQGGRAGLMKPLVVLALPGMYLFYKYSQYRREQRELSRRRITERELQHLHHKIDKLLTKLEENEPELASSQEDEIAQGPGGMGGPPHPPHGLMGGPPAPPGGMGGPGGGKGGVGGQAGGQMSGGFGGQGGGESDMNEGSRQRRNLADDEPQTFFIEFTDKIHNDMQGLAGGARGRRSPQRRPKGPENMGRKF